MRGGVNDFPPDKGGLRGVAKNYPVTGGGLKMNYSNTIIIIIYKALFAHAQRAAVGGEKGIPRQKTYDAVLLSTVA
jgi:hypothetical protein